MGAFQTSSIEFHDNRGPHISSEFSDCVALPQATFDCLMKTYGFLTPDLWKETRFSKAPFQEFTDLLAKPVGKALIAEDVERIES